MTKTTRLFDIAEYSEKGRAALNKLKESQRPGEHSGKGGKADVIQALKKDIKALLDEGYTTRQIAAAFKEDVFGILPKTITEIVIGKPKPPKAASSAKKTTPNPTQLSSSPTKNDAVNSAQKKPMTEIGDVD